jgi:S1-C subfamily serine protease
MGVRFLGVLIAAVTLTTVLSATLQAAQRNLPLLQRGPDLLLLQDLGSEIRASVRPLQDDRPPEVRSGVVVEQVVRGGPADDGDLRAGDIFTEFDGETITDPRHFTRVVRDTPPGRRVKVIFWREGERREVFLRPVAARAQ